LPAEVIAGLQRGETAARGQVFDAYSERVFNTCRRITGCDADAEDATQEVFLRVFAQASTFAGQSRFSTWLLRVAVNHTINMCRARKRRLHSTFGTLSDVGDLGDSSEPTATGLPPDQQPAPLEAAIHREECQHLDAALQSLPLDQRTIVVLREIDGLTYAEIGKVLDLPPGTVTSRLVRGRQRLAQALRRYLPCDHDPRSDQKS
jgi:RNA polymerase sigma-70 factor (ECF subfamily)